MRYWARSRAAALYLRSRRVRRAAPSPGAPFERSPVRSLVTSGAASSRRAGQARCHEIGICRDPADERRGLHHVGAEPARKARAALIIWLGARGAAARLSVL